MLLKRIEENNLQLVENIYIIIGLSLLRVCLEVTVVDRLDQLLGHLDDLLATGWPTR